MCIGEMCKRRAQFSESPFLRQEKPTATQCRLRRFDQQCLALLVEVWHVSEVVKTWSKAVDFPGAVAFIGLVTPLRIRPDRLGTACATWDTLICAPTPAAG